MRDHAPLLALVLAALSSGCASTLDYRPNEELVQQLGLEESKRRLGEVMTRAVVPVIGSVDATEDSYHYRGQQTVHGVYGVPMGAVPLEKTVYYTNIGRLQVFSNHYVYVWSQNEQLLDQILFANAEDAKAFTDLVMSYRARRSAPPK